MFGSLGTAEGNARRQTPTRTREELGHIDHFRSKTASIKPPRARLQRCRQRQPRANGAHQRAKRHLRGGLFYLHPGESSRRCPTKIASYPPRLHALHGTCSYGDRTCLRSQPSTVKRTLFKAKRTNETAEIYSHSSPRYSSLVVAASEARADIIFRHRSGRHPADRATPPFSDTTCPATRCRGHTNSTHTIFNIFSNETLVGTGGQAQVAAHDGSYNLFFIEAANAPLTTFNQFEANVRINVQHERHRRR